jgi:hypothetical protein
MNIPYLAGAAPEISSVLKRFCDHEWKNSKLHLILSGSSAQQLLSLCHVQNDLNTKWATFLAAATSDTVLAGSV